MAEKELVEDMKATITRALFSNRFRGVVFSYNSIFEIVKHTYDTLNTFRKLDEDFTLENILTKM